MPGLNGAPVQRGSRQGGVREYNERVVIETVRRHGALPAADIARQTQLTAQTVSMIAKRLLDDQLLVKGKPRRGKVGQPSVPLSLNPDGAFAIGIKVGRRTLDTLLVDFTGAARLRYTLDYQRADPQRVLAEIDSRMRDIRGELSNEQRSRIQGVGIAAPLSMGGWQQLLGVPGRTADQWRRIDLASEVAIRTDLPVTLLKDTAAACVAELVTGGGSGLRNFLYVFVDTFIGGGLVLDGHLRPGLSGNAGAIGSMPLGVAGGGRDGPPAQLLSVASLFNLEQRYAAAHNDPGAANDDRALDAPWRKTTGRWLDEASRAIAQVITSSACLLDLDGVIVDGSIGRRLQAALLEAVEGALGGYDWEGVQRPRLVAGSVGGDAQAIGGALLPLHANFAPDRGLFLKS